MNIYRYVLFLLFALSVASGCARHRDSAAHTFIVASWFLSIGQSTELPNDPTATISLVRISGDGRQALLELYESSSGRRTLVWCKLSGRVNLSEAFDGTLTLDAIERDYVVLTAKYSVDCPTGDETKPGQDSNSPAADY